MIVKEYTKRKCRFKVKKQRVYFQSGHDFHVLQTVHCFCAATVLSCLYETFTIRQPKLKNG